MTELATSADAVLDGKASPHELEVAQSGRKIADALQESLETSKKIEGDAGGSRVERRSKL